MKTFDIETQAQVITIINRHMFKIVLLLACLFFFSQFVILATIGTRGAEITNIRAEKEFLRVENERLRSNIDKAKTLDQVQATLNDVYELYPAGVETIYSVDYADELTLGLLP